VAWILAYRNQQGRARSLALRDAAGEGDGEFRLHVVVFRSKNMTAPKHTLVRRWRQ
jgi:hypothetical protein